MIEGSIVALITPMTEEQQVDYKGLQTLVAFHLANQTDGILLLGTTGESTTLSSEEEKRIVHSVMEQVDHKVPIIVGVGTNSTEKTVTRARIFAEMGVDALLVITPYYNKTSDAGMLAHFTTIADAVDVPIILYNVPSRTGISISINVLRILAQHPNIQGIKEASGDFSYLMQVARLVTADFVLYSGNDELIVPTLSVGGIGAISVLANVAPKEVHTLVQNYLSGKTTLAKEQQLDLLPLIDALFMEVNPIPVKSALNYLQLPAGPLRLPLVSLNEEQRKQLEKVMPQLEQEGV
ncbi:MAG: 4-hydroxy-tetrahydrodipicolinate synthase [Enterococcus sp.]